MLYIPFFMGLLLSSGLSAAAPVKKASAPSQKAVKAKITSSQTLPEVILQALKAHPQVQERYAEVEGNRHQLQEAYGGYGPTVDVEASGGGEYTKQKFRPNALNSSALKGRVKNTRFGASVRVRQMIFDGLKTQADVTRVKQEIHLSEARIQQIREELCRKIAQQYIAVRRFSRLLRLAKDNVIVHEVITKKIEQLKEAGKATIADVYTGQARLNEAKAAAKDIEGDLQISVAHYASLTGFQPVQLKRPTIPRSYLPVSVEEAIQESQRHNKRLHVLRHDLGVVQAEIKMSRSAFSPRVDLEVDASRRFDNNAKSGTENSLTAMAVMRYNVFKSGQDVSKFREVRAKARQVKHRLEQEKREAEKQVRTAWIEWQSTTGQLEALEEAVTSKRQIRDTYLEQFALGQRSYLDILNVSHEFFMAKGSLINAQAGLDNAQISLLEAMGKAHMVMMAWY